MKNEGQSIENQINGAIDVLEERLKKVGLTLESVIQMDCLLCKHSRSKCLARHFKKSFQRKISYKKSL